MPPAAAAERHPVHQPRSAASRTAPIAAPIADSAGAAHAAVPSSTIGSLIARVRDLDHRRWSADAAPTIAIATSDRQRGKNQSCADSRYVVASAQSAPHRLAIAQHNRSARTPGAASVWRRYHDSTSPRTPTTSRPSIASAEAAQIRNTAPRQRALRRPGARRRARSPPATARAPGGRARRGRRRDRLAGLPDDSAANARRRTSPSSACRRA